MRDSELVVLAAELLEEYPLSMQIGACGAITFLAFEKVWPEAGFYSLEKAEKINLAIEFSRTFKPEDNWSAWWGEAWSDDPQERRDCRILALLLFAEMLEEEGR